MSMETSKLSCDFMQAVDTGFDTYCPECRAFALDIDCSITWLTQSINMQRSVLLRRTMPVCLGSRIKS